MSRDLHAEIEPSRHGYWVRICWGTSRSSLTWKLMRRSAERAARRHLRKLQADDERREQTWRVEL